ncbi:hypothetical protein BT69DRAFT_1211080 [Atractiella rhizophila]|nr:hypothetical protein BT69DRAFT_1211080 [Atractiella rhizophila]
MVESKSLSLKNILQNGDGDDLINLQDFNGHLDETEGEASTSHMTEGYCVECEDQPAEIHCETCEDSYCSVCFQSQHRKGKRAKHATRLLVPTTVTKNISSQVSQTNGHSSSKKEEDAEEMDTDSSDDELEASYQHASVPTLPSVSNTATTKHAQSPASFVERAKYIPIRLTLTERKMLRLLEAALSVSEYTDKVDIMLWGKSRTKRIVAQVKEICSIISGLLVAADYSQGQELFQSRDFAKNASFYQRIFEIGRRHKIMNPEKMRTTYLKLMYMLQDSLDPEIAEMLEFSTFTPIKTVYTTLDELNCLPLLEEETLATATQEILSAGRSRREVQFSIRAKERAIERLSTKYARLSGADEELVKTCIYSLGDNNAFLRVNRDPCLKLIEWLKKFFHPTTAVEGRNLSIRAGKNGARLTHGHERQYAYCLQSLTLWSQILENMFELWSLAESDLLSDKIFYRMKDTGQGLNRVQAAPKTSRKMHEILHKAQSSVGYWVGSSVIHMGDHNVPNSHFFLDKYSQIYRICLPVCNVLDQIPKMMENPSIRRYIESEFGSDGQLYVDILGDFFRHAFDGSGADNFFDAGSCIDGRLTSAWDWCSKLEKKKYFPIFQLASFNSFDGDW